MVWTGKKFGARATKIERMSDPAVQAARRAERAPGECNVICESMIEAARQAFKPIQELHRRFDRGHEVVCHDCRNGSGDFVPWPCDTAKLIYTSEDLDR